MPGSERKARVRWPLLHAIGYNAKTKGPIYQLQDAQSDSPGGTAWIGKAMIRAVGLTRHFGETVAVEDLQLDIAEGELFGLLGPAGAGKTTTVRLLAALLAPTAGEAWIGDLQLGVNEVTNAAIRRSIGVMTGMPGLYERLSAEYNLRLFAGLYGLRDGATQAQRYLQLFDLWEERKTPVERFPVGMKRKLALARALLHEPRVLLLDEPTHGLGPEAAQEVLETLLELRSEGLTMFLCTPSLVEAARVCDRIGVFRQHVLLVETPERLCQELWEPQMLFRMRGRAGPYEQLLGALPFVRAVASSENTLYAALTTGSAKREAVAAMVRRLVEAGADLFEVGEVERSLEDAYLPLLEEEAAAPPVREAAAAPARMAPVSPTPASAMPAQPAPTSPTPGSPTPGSPTPGYSAGASAMPSYRTGALPADVSSMPGSSADASPSSARVEGMGRSSPEIGLQRGDADEW
jgi:ABC-2 type transport system ATP-binding protein